MKTIITYLSLACLLIFTSCEKKQYFDEELREYYDTFIEFEDYLIEHKYLKDSTGKSYQALWEAIQDSNKVFVKKWKIIPQLDISDSLNRIKFKKMFTTLRDSLGYPKVKPAISMTAYMGSIDEKSDIKPDSLARGIINSFAKHLDTNWETHYKIAFLLFLYTTAENPYQVTLYIKSDETILWNGEEIEVTDIAQKALKLQTSLPDSLYKKVVVSLKADEEVKMRVLTDVKMQLREGNARRINYTTVIKK